MAFGLGQLQDLAVERIEQLSTEMEAKAVKGAARGSEAAEQPACGEGVGAVGEPQGGGEVLGVEFKEDEGKKEVGRVEGATDARVGM
jgi:hypothetical protein